MLFLNLLYVAAFIVFYRFMQKHFNWFQTEHFARPEWVSFALGLGGILVPVTPLFIDGMIVGTVVYFLNEGVFQATGWSPLTDGYSWLKNKILWLWRFFRDADVAEQKGE